MASFYKAFLKFKGIEFNNPKNVLHVNKGENGLTYYGIYESAHPKWRGWDRVKDYLDRSGGDIDVASARAYSDKNIEAIVYYFYYVNYWTPLKLDKIKSQKIAEEMFFFYVNIGNKKKVVRYAQSIVGEVVDGAIGKNTIRSLNNFDEEIFDKEYDGKEISHYKRLVRYNPKRFGIFLKGWINRAKRV